MKKVLGLFIVLGVARVAQAADIEAGKEVVATVCAVCHGANRQRRGVLRLAASACHKPLANVSCTSALKQLAEAKVINLKTAKTLGLTIPQRCLRKPTR